MPISQERELEIERELDAIMRELDRHAPLEKAETHSAQASNSAPVGTAAST